jgi:alpha,alpha-trehalose phosphorylase
MAVHYEVEAVDQPARVVVQSELVANEDVATRKRDPRVAAILKKPLEAVEHDGEKNRAYLIHRTRESKLLMAVAMDHIFHEEHLRGTELAVHPDWARVTAGTVLEPGETLSVTKFVAYGWSSQRSVPALRDQVHAALIAAHGAGWDRLLSDQREALDLFWNGADVEIDGDPAIQQAVRFALFHTYQAAARAEVRSIPAKGLTGPGYDGHAFWDTEGFVLPVLTAVAPHSAADAIHWRAAILDMARERAQSLRLQGAAFPWRTIRGQECSGYWPAGTAAFHVNADIAVAAIRYVRWTDDRDFERSVALPILVETARLWMSLGYHGADGEFHIDGVTGPDEYSAIVDDNVFTNLMAKQNLAGAADAAERHPAESAELGVAAAEIAAWRAAASVVAVPYDEKRQVHQQDKAFTDHEVWDFERSAAENAYPLLLNEPYFDIYRKQVVKQADLILAMHWCGDQFTLDEKARAFAYYEPLTVRDSSLSACTQAVIAAEVGQHELATDYLAEAALVDLDDLHGNTSDGVHIASLAGTWLAIVAGFGGLRDHGDVVSLHPQLPAHWKALTFRFRWREARVRVEVRRDGVVYDLVGDDVDQVELVDCGEPIVVRRGQPLSRPFCPVEPLTERPEQPPGRAPQPAADLLAELAPPDDKLEGAMDPDPVEG